MRKQKKNATRRSRPGVSHPGATLKSSAATEARDRSFDSARLTLICFYKGTECSAPQTPPPPSSPPFVLSPALKGQNLLSILPAMLKKKKKKGEAMVKLHLQHLSRR